MTSSPVRVAVRLLRASLLAALLTCALLAALGTLWVVVDQSSHDDPWDGVDTWFGTVLAGSAVVLGVVVVLLVVVLTRALRRRERTGSALALSLTSVAAAVVASPFGLLALSDLRSPLALLGLVPGAVVASSVAVALAAIHEARQPTNAATRSW